MVDFMSHFGTFSSPEPVQHFSLVRITGSPVLVRILPVEPEAVRVHWLKAEPNTGWTLCPGFGCPLCALGEYLQKWVLLLTVNLVSRDAQVLAVPESKEPSSLLNALGPHLKGDTTTKFFEISRGDGKRHRVSPRALPAAPDDCSAEAADALERAKQGASLASAIRQYSADEIAEFPEIARQLRLRGIDPREELNDEPR